MSEGESERKIFFPAFMFMGMGVGFLLIPLLGGLGFVSSMFIGMGLGMLFDNLVKIESGKVVWRPSAQLGGVAAMVIGAFLIAVGFIAIFRPRLLERLAASFVGLALIAIGILILLIGISMMKTKTSYQPGGVTSK